MSRDKQESSEVYLEFTQVGNMVRVNAVDAVTGVEVSFAGPRNTPQSELKRTAIAKLKYVLNKQKKD